MGGLVMRVPCTALDTSLSVTTRPGALTGTAGAFFSDGQHELVTSRHGVHAEWMEVG